MLYMYWTELNWISGGWIQQPLTGTPDIHSRGEEGQDGILDNQLCGPYHPIIRLDDHDYVDLHSRRHKTSMRKKDMLNALAKKKRKTKMVKPYTWKCFQG